MFDHTAFDAHEGVHFFHDADSGLRCVIALHSTVRGPAAGGCRMWSYASSADMVTDALRLSRGMSLKNAMADLPLGGGKAVIWGDSRTGKSEALFRAFGRAVDQLQGRYYTAEDVGIDVADIAIAAQETPFVAGTDAGTGGKGDPSPVTARGVFLGMIECARRVFGTEDLDGRTVAVQGVGSVGGHLCTLLAEEGARLVICDTDHDALETVRLATGADVVAPDDIYDVPADIFSPNALGAVLTPATLARLSARIIAGGANNQLATPEMGDRLAERGVLYAPDYVINGGGIINVAAEISGTYDSTWVDDKLASLIETLGKVLDEALSTGASTDAVAERMARERIAAARSSRSGA